MFQNSVFDVERYTPVGDIAVLALCIIMGILMFQSFITKSQRFRLIIVTLITTMGAAFTSIVYEMLMYSKNIMPIPIYAARIVHNILVAIVLYLYIQYLYEPLWISTENQKRYSFISAFSIIICVIIDIIGIKTKTGFYVTKDGEYHSGFRPYIIIYVLFMSTILWVIIKYRDRLIRQAFTGLIGTNIIAVAIIEIQRIHNQVSFTTFSYFLPIIGIAFMFHSNPYDIETGTVSDTFFYSEVSENISKGKNMLIMSCYMPNFSKLMRDSNELKLEFYKFLKTNVKKGVIYHFPNETFVLTMKKKSKKGIGKLVSKMLDDFKHSYEKFNIDYKIVVLETTPDITSTIDYIKLIEYAEQHMMLNEIHRITPNDIKNFYDSIYILDQLKDIVEKQDLSDPRVIAYCQPVFNTSICKYDTAEALMRIKLEKTGMIFPDQFIPLAEQYNIIHPLSMIILSKTCSAIKQFIDEGFEISRISVNFSTLDIRRENFCNEVKQIIEQNKIPYSKIAAEITESRSDADFNIMKKRVMQLQNLGIKFYLDDFGTGYSNFERIMEIPFDIIKFDRSMLIEYVKSDSSRFMVQTFANMFNTLQYSVLFEGVENDSDERRCVMMKAKYLQGYKYSKPIPIEDLRKFLSKTKK